MAQEDQRTAPRRAERELERRLRSLAEEGELSGLPGEGRPLPRDGGDAAGDRWAAFHVMANAGVPPAWSEQRSEIDREHAALVARARAHLAWAEHRRRALRDLAADRILEEARRSREGDARVRRAIAADVARLNERIARLERQVPVPSLAPPPLSLERVFEEAAEPPDAR